PLCIQGRAGALNIDTGRGNLLVGGAYFPPKVSSQAENQRRNEAIREIIRFMEKVHLEAVTSRTTPVWGTDTNEGVGLQKRRGEVCPAAGETVGSAEPSLEGY
ncbi:MAG: hypothetical protein ACKPKO_29300, partial [Candidatus Fonsibacter sp.]